MEAWYVLQTRAHKEPVTERRLASCGVESYLPRIVERVRAGLRMQTRISPMFPCYLFVKADLEVSTRLLRYAPGVRDFVRVGAFPESLDGSTIEGLKARIGESNVYTPRPRRFEPGERLRICQGGALGGLEVIFERELAGHERVAVLLAEVTLAARLVLSAESLCSIA